MEEACFPEDPKQALTNALVVAENNSLTFESGSCALVMLILEDQCYLANIGDSKAVMSVSAGKTFLSLCQEHVLSDVREASRVMVAGASIYS